jgi:polyphenol oxidase
VSGRSLTPSVAAVSAGLAVHPQWLRPAWPADGVGALMTTRDGGASAAPFDTMNLRLQPGESAAAVRENQARLASLVGAAPVWLEQVHGRRVVRIGLADVDPGAPIHRADASLTTEAGIACAIQTADCLPVLFAAPGGRAVGAAHAGWRGLAAGVLEATLAAVAEAAACAPAEVAVWLGACIGPQRFEVGRDVVDAFGEAGAGRRFVPHGEAKWLADLAGLATDRLVAAGATAIDGGTWCTHTDASRFYSYRRDGVTGRMAALVWIDPKARR